MQPTITPGHALLEKNLFLTFDALRERLLAQLQVAASCDTVDREEILLDCFLLAAGLNQILEDYLHRDFLSLRKAATQLRDLLPVIGPVASGAALLASKVVSWARSLRMRQARLRSRQRDLSALVDLLASRVADRAAHEGRRLPLPRAACSETQLLHLAERVMLPFNFPVVLRRSVQRLPNCFRSFDQQPADCDRIVQRFSAQHPDRSRPLLVVGLRTSGNYLAPLCAHFLVAAGYENVRVITTRSGCPLDRAEVKEVRAVAARHGLGLLVDDPPRTGAQLSDAAVMLGRLGLSDVLLMLQGPGDDVSLPPSLRAWPSILLPNREWIICDRLGPEALNQALQALLVGHVELDDGHESAGSAVAAELLKMWPGGRGHVIAHVVARLTDGDGDGNETILPLCVEGVGLGYFGRHALALARAMDGYVPTVYGVRDGLLFRAWLPEDSRVVPSRLSLESDSVAAAVSGYVATRQRLLPLDEDITVGMAGNDPAWEGVAQMLGDAFGQMKPFVRPLTFRAARRLVRVDHPSICDEAMAPGQWFGEDGEPLRKIKFQQRASTNVGFRSCDPVFDLAEAAATSEALGEPHFGVSLRSDYESLTHESIEEERWLLYRLLHHLTAYQVTLRDAATDPSNGQASFGRALALEQTMATIYRRYFEANYFSDLEPVVDGPLCAIDLDGVLENRWIAFPAISTAGAMALRSLNVHGHRTILATGRSLDEVQARCAAYRMSGGVAEYGSVVYDHVRGRTRSLISVEDRAALMALTDVLERIEGVHVDPLYRHCVRAHFLDPTGERRSLPAETMRWALSAARVGGAVVVMPGELQTDFVTAGINKGRGLRALVELFGEDAKRHPLVALAVGDSGPDLAMFALAARAVAPANATAEVRDHAQVVRGSYQTGLLRAVHNELGHSGRRCVACRPPRPGSTQGRLLLTSLAALNGGWRGKVAKALALTTFLALAGS
jgi:hydroxymethylpyrimidine pyrophosphatase-like HAD family hydrolase